MKPPGGGSQLSLGEEPCRAQGAGEEAEEPCVRWGAVWHHGEPEAGGAHRLSSLVQWCVGSLVWSSAEV